MQDLFQNYIDDLNKLRDAFHDELAAQARELSKAMGNYSERCDAILAPFMEKVSARGVELEAAAAARLDQFRGPPVSGSSLEVRYRPLANPSKSGSRESRSRRRAGVGGQPGYRRRSRSQDGPPDGAC